MKVTLSWLREFAPDIGGEPAFLSETLSALGLAVEEMTLLGGVVDGVVLAKVANLRPHPSASKIQLVDVDFGTGYTQQVCCGAFNMAVGDLIPFATTGTVMPDGTVIKKRLMRNEESNGMCCSGAELGLSEDHEGILILNDSVVADAKLGMPLEAAIGAERDVLWDLEVNANRPDAMSVAGVARDLAAALGVGFSFPEDGIAEESFLEGETAEGLLKVEIADPTLCGRFVAGVIRGVVISEAPKWLAERLTLAGMRPVNSIVDISNYVMLELGQPNHAFDLAAVPNGNLRVRRAKEGETLVTLDGATRNLEPYDGVIANGADEVLSLAGVMGGASSEISAATTDVLLELAWWDPPSISRTAKRLNLLSEASTRFRRGVDWGDNIIRAYWRFVQLASEAGAKAAKGFVDVAGNTPDRSAVSVRSSKVNSILGTNLSAATMARHLRSTGFEAEVVEPNLKVVVPTWRWDTETETDIAEEVARLHGYMNIGRTIRRGTQAAGLTEMQRLRRVVRQALVGFGCDETQTLPFWSPTDPQKAGLADDCIRLTNPLAADQSALRTSLIVGQLNAIVYNQSHRHPEMRFFEIGHVFLSPQPNQPLPDEREHLGVALAGEGAPMAVAVVDLLNEALGLVNVELKQGKLAGLHSTRSAEVIVAGKTRGVVGEVSPWVLEKFGITGRVAWLEIDLGAVLSGPRRKRKSVAISKFPSADFDLAFVMPNEVTASAVERTLRTAGKPLLYQLELFDIYRGTGVAEGTRSLAYRVRLQAQDRTLSDADVASVRTKLIEAVANRHKAKLRS